MTALADRIAALRRLAERRGVADKVGHLPSAELAIQAYADALGFDPGLAANLDMPLKDVEELTMLSKGRAD